MKIKNTHIVALGPGIKFSKCHEAKYTDINGLTITKYFLEHSHGKLVEIDYERFDELDNYSTEKAKEIQYGSWVC